MTIIVNPPTTPSSAPATRAGETYVYTSIVASTDANGKYTVPSTQKPDTETLIDPHADFLVGISTQDYSQSQAGKQLDLRFTRPVAISRLSIMNVEDPTIKQVKIYSSDKLTGSASYENVNFENATVSFDNSGSNVITLDYGSGVAMPAEGIFNAYFISLVGTKRITKIEVVTNTQTLSKEFEGGKALTFKVPDFKSIAVNMGASGSVTPGDDEDKPQNIYFFKDDKAITEDTYDLYSEEDYVYPTVKGLAPGATLTFESSNEAVATVTEEGVVTPVSTGEATIYVTASAAPGYYQAGEAQFTLTVTDSTPEPVYQPLKFMRGGEEITDDTYDLNSGVPYETPELKGVVDEATVEWDILCIPEGCATIDADGKVTPVAVGSVTVTATASAVAPLYNETTKSYTLEITDTTPSTTADYLLVSEVEDVVEGTYLIVSADGEKVFDGSGTYQGGYTTIANSSAITVDGDKISISGDQSAYEFSFAKSGNGFTITGAKGMIVAAAHSGASTSQETYITFAATGGSVFLQRGKLTSDDKALLFSTTRGTSSEEYLYFNTNNSIFKIGGSGSTRGIHLYKFDDGTPKPVFQPLKFMKGGEEITDDNYDLNSGVPYETPELTGVVDEATVEWDILCIPEGCATIDADGKVTPVAVGSVTVTATASAVAPLYNETTKSYTLEITDTTPSTTADYLLVSEVEDVVEGTYLIVSADGEKVFDGSGTYQGGYTTIANSSAITVDGDKISISGDQSAYEFSFAKSGNGFTITGAKGMIVAAAHSGASTSQETYITFAATGGSVFLQRGKLTSDDKALLFSTTRGTSSEEYLYFNTNNSIFKIGGSGSTRGIHLYKFDDGQLKKQTLSFEPDSVTGKVGDTVTAPTLSGAKTTVTYSSDDETIAEVDANGALTLKAAGTTTIRATAAEENGYAGATASYEVTVTEETTPPSTSKYVRVDSNDDLGEGSYLVVYENGASSKVFKVIVSGTTVTQSAANAIDAVVTDGELQGSDDIDACLVELVASGSNYFMKAGDYYIYPSQSNLAAETSPTDSRALAVTISSGKVTIKRSQYDHYLTYNEYFRRGGSDTGNMALYVLDDGKPKDQKLAFSETEVNYNMAGSPEFVEPTLSGAKTTVTYASDATSVATVNANTGEVTIQGVGAANITATAIATDKYNKGEASYKITVINKTQYYVKVNSRDGLPGTSQTSATGDYLFVYEDGSKAYVFKAICNGTPTGAGNTSNGHVELEKTGSAIEVALTSDGILATDAVKACKVELAHHSDATRNDWTIKPASLGTYWVRINNDRNNGLRILAMTSSGYSSTFTFDGTGNNLEIKRTDSSRTAYWSYNASSNCFEATATASTISIYQLSE